MWPDGLGTRSDVSRVHRDQPGIRNRMDTSGDAMKTISTHRDAAKLFNSPVKPAGWPINDGESRKPASRCKVVYRGSGWARELPRHAECPHIRGDGNGSSRPRNASEISDLTARSAESHMGEPVRLESQMDTGRHAQSDANDSKTAVKTSETPKRANCARHTC